MQTFIIQNNFNKMLVGMYVAKGNNSNRNDNKAIEQ